MAIIDATTFKPGDTFSWGGAVGPLPAGTWSGVSKVRQLDGTLVETLTVTVAAKLTPDADGCTHDVTVLGASNVTDDWPKENLRWDLRLVDGSAPPVKVTFPTVNIKCARAQSE